jgi:HEAT repeat protein
MGLVETVYRVKLSKEETTAIAEALRAYDMSAIRIRFRRGVPDEGRVTLYAAAGGKEITVDKWANDKNDDFDAIYAGLVKIADAAKETEQVRTGAYDGGWTPEGFPDGAKIRAARPRRGGGGEMERADVADLIKSLGDADAAVRMKAIDALGRIGPDAKQAAPALLPFLGDPSAEMRGRAVVALGEIGPDAKESIPGLIKALGDTDASVRKCAVLALYGIGPESKDAVAALVKSLEDTDLTVRMNAALALGRMGPGAKDAVPALVKTLGQKEAGLRAVAADALGGIGPEAKGAVGELERLAEKDPQEFVRQYAHDALGKIQK